MTMKNNTVSVLINHLLMSEGTSTYMLKQRDLADGPWKVVATGLSYQRANLALEELQAKRARGEIWDCGMWEDSSN